VQWLILNADRIPSRAPPRRPLKRRRLASTHRPGGARCPISRGKALGVAVWHKDGLGAFLGLRYVALADIADAVARSCRPCGAASVEQLVDPLDFPPQPHDRLRVSGADGITDVEQSPVALEQEWIALDEERTKVWTEHLVSVPTRDTEPSPPAPAARDPGPRHPASGRGFADRVRQNLSLR